MRKKHIQMLAAAISAMLIMTGCSSTGISEASGGGEGAAAGDAQPPEGDQGVSSASAGSGSLDASEAQPGARADDAGTDVSRERAYSEGVALVSHEMETVERRKFPALEEKEPYARVTYPQILLSDELRALYPALGEALDQINLDKKALAWHQLSMKSLYAEEMEGNLPAYLSYESSCEIKRCDEKLFAYVDTEYDDMGGAHPNTVVKTMALDPVSGSILKLSDVASEGDDMAEAILKELYPESQPDYTFSREAQREMQSIIRQEIKDGSIKWVMDHSGLSFYFSPYELSSYSLGVLRADLDYGAYSGLIKQEYSSVGEEFACRSFKDGDVVRQPLKELERYKSMNEASLEVFPDIFERRDEAKADVSEAVSVSNPGWEYFYDGPQVKVAAPKVEILSADRTDWLNQDRWSAENNIALTPAFPYSEGGYRFERIGESGWYLRISAALPSGEEGEAYEGRTMEGEKVFDFSEFMEPDSRSDSLFADFADMEIIHAEIYDGVLYVSIGHRTYAESQPHTAFIVAVSMEDGRCIWKSDDQVSNSSNFLIGEDIIITGYGFTDEPDYMYILNRHTGEVISTTKLYTGPDHFINMEDGTMYVLTYDTVYLMRVE